MTATLVMVPSCLPYRGSRVCGGPRGSGLEGARRDQGRVTAAPETVLVPQVTRLDVLHFYTASRCPAVWVPASGGRGMSPARTSTQTILVCRYTRRRNVCTWPPPSSWCHARTSPGRRSVLSCSQLRIGRLPNRYTVCRAPAMLALVAHSMFRRVRHRSESRVSWATAPNTMVWPSTTCGSVREFALNQTCRRMMAISAQSAGSWYAASISCGGRNCSSQSSRGRWIPGSPGCSARGRGGCEPAGPAERGWAVAK